MFKLVQYLLDWLRSIFIKKEMELSLIGLQAAGKSSLVNVLTTGVFHEEMIPTVGFIMRRITKGGVTIKMWDLGGSAAIQEPVGALLPGVQAIVYVVDAADYDNVVLSTTELQALLVKPSLKGIPLLVLGNKSDLPGALNTQDLIARMELKSLKGREVCVYSISCKKSTNIDITLEWLTRHAKA
ncbi:MAG: hypothetical protein WDW38_003047 [Sanguina aurantia]